MKKWVIEQAMFTYSPLGKAFEKNWRSRQKQIESLKEHEKKPVESNELVKKDFKIDSTPLDGQKKKI